MKITKNVLEFCWKGLSLFPNRLYIIIAKYTVWRNIRKKLQFGKPSG